jgi:hypothetical protein
MIRQFKIIDSQREDSTEKDHALKIMQGENTEMAHAYQEKEE